MASNSKHNHARSMKGASRNDLKEKASFNQSLEYFIKELDAGGSFTYPHPLEERQSIPRAQDSQSRHNQDPRQLGQRQARPAADSVQPIQQAKPILSSKSSHSAYQSQGQHEQPRQSKRHHSSKTVHQPRPQPQHYAQQPASRSSQRQQMVSNIQPQHAGHKTASLPPISGLQSRSTQGPRQVWPSYTQPAPQPQQWPPRVAQAQYPAYNLQPTAGQPRQEQWAGQARKKTAVSDKRPAAPVPSIAKNPVMGGQAPPKKSRFGFRKFLS